MTYLFTVFASGVYAIMQRIEFYRNSHSAGNHPSGRCFAYAQHDDFVYTAAPSFIAGGFYLALASKTILQSPSAKSGSWVTRSNAPS